MAPTESRLVTKPASARVEPTSSSRARWMLVAAWVVGFPLAVALEPALSVGAAEPWWASVLAYGFLGALVATLTGLTRGRPWATGASLVTSLFFATTVFLCPATGHHAFGFWWIGEFAVSLALVALSGLTYMRRQA